MTKVAKIFTSHRFSHVTLVAADMLGVIGGFRLAFLFYIQWGVLYAGEAAAPSYNFYLALAGVILPFYWLLFKLHGLYRFRLNLSLLEVLPAIVTAVTEASMVLLAITMVIFPVVHYSRNIIVISWISTIICVSLARLIIYMIFRWGRRRGWYVKNTLVLGAGKVGISCAEKIRHNPELGLRFVGFLDEQPSERATK
ncbi:MAG: hypothetical protein JJD96_06235, partial [Thermoleophilia bacterium]|nr:hypothetical protein [Thermoleophilia bacterium]